MTELKFEEVLELIKNLSMGTKELQTIVSTPDIDEDVPYHYDKNLPIYSGHACYTHNDYDAFTDFGWNDAIEPAFPPDNYIEILSDVASNIADENCGLFVMDRGRVILNLKPNEVKIIGYEKYLN